MSLGAAYALRATRRALVRPSRDCTRAGPGPEFSPLNGEAVRPGPMPAAPWTQTGEQHESRDLDG
jgi:hypothetical protein